MDEDTIILIFFIVGTLIGVWIVIVGLKLSRDMELYVLDVSCGEEWNRGRANLQKEIKERQEEWDKRQEREGRRRLKIKQNGSDWHSCC